MAMLLALLLLACGIALSRGGAPVAEEGADLDAGMSPEALQTDGTLGEASHSQAQVDGGTAVRLELNAGEIVLGVGERLDLGATLLDGDGNAVEGPLAYASDSVEYAAVDAHGVVTGVKRGSARVTVTSESGLRATCKVTVRNAPRSIQLTAKKAKLVYAPGSADSDGTTLRVTLSQGSASAIAFSDYDPTVVRVSESGEVTAVGCGATSVRATTYNGLSAQCTVRVMSPGDLVVGNVAHRGGAAYWPENTLEAFENAPSTGATAVELDVQSTKDGVQVIHHDNYFTVDDKKVRIRKRNYETLKRLNPSLCTLDEALEVISRSELGLYLELKGSSDVEQCLEAVDRWGMRDRTVYISFLKPKLRKVRKLDGAARLGYIITQTPDDLDAFVAKLGIGMISQFKGELTRENIAKWQAQGLLVNVWTVNGKGEIRKYLRWGVDSITGDYPKRVTEALNP